MNFPAESTTTDLRKLDLRHVSISQFAAAVNHCASLTASLTSGFSVDLSGVQSALKHTHDYAAREGSQWDDDSYHEIYGGCREGALHTMEQAIGIATQCAPSIGERVLEAVMADLMISTNRPKNEEELYRLPSADESASPLVSTIDSELKRYFARYPERLYHLDPRKFEVLVADILKDLGFDTELTSITRDGGRDVYAYMRTAVASFLMFVECKRWTPPKHVGIAVVQRIHGASKAGHADKAMVVTTSFFTAPARREQQSIATELVLVDYDQFKEWLEPYRGAA